MYGTEAQPGIVPTSLETLFQIPATFKIAYYEIYNESIRDLLMLGELTKAPSKLKVTSLEHVKLLMKKGEKHQHVNETEWNQHSTRGHVVFQVVKQY